MLFLTKAKTPKVGNKNFFTVAVALIFFAVTMSGTGCKPKKKASLGAVVVCQKLNANGQCDLNETTLPRMMTTLSAEVSIRNGISDATVSFELKHLKDTGPQNLDSRQTTYKGSGDGKAYVTFAIADTTFQSGNYSVEAKYADSKTTQSASTSFVIGKGQDENASAAIGAGAEAVALSFSTHQPDPRVSEAVQKSTAIENVRAVLNKEMKIPKISADFKTCGKVNSWYDPSSKRITMCYEWLIRLYEVLRTNQAGKTAAISALDVFAFTFLHEFAHAIIHQHKIPITGGSEDAADEMATLFFIADKKPASVFNAAHFFYLSGAKGNIGNQAFFDEHGPAQVRAGNLFCAIYGSDPKKYQDFVTKGLVLASRAQKCSIDLKARAEAWTSLLKDISRL